jgi:hypothetical protein
MPTYKGVKVNFGVSSSLAAVGTFSLQSRDHTKKSDKEENRGSQGDVEQVTYYNQTEEATFTYIRKDGSASGGNLTISATVDPGTSVTVADANNYNVITGSTWIVEEVSTQGSNTGALRETLRLMRYAGF